MATIFLTSVAHDRAPCLVNWDNVTLAIEKFTSGDNGDKFHFTKVYLAEGGTTYVQVRETAAEIHELLGAASF